MSNLILAQAIQFLANLILGSDTFTRVLGVIQRWDTKEVSNAEKRGGVVGEFEIIGLDLTESLSNLAVELGVSYLKFAGKDTTSAPTLNDVKSEVVNTVETTLANDAPAAIATVDATIPAQ
jgi:hypothetical protein